MSLLSLLLCLLLEQLRPLGPEPWPLRAFGHFADVVARNLNAGRRRHGALGWAVAVLPWVVVSDTVFYLLGRVHMIPALVWSVAVLYLALGVRQFSGGFTAVHLALREGRTDDARRHLADWTGLATREFGPAELSRVAIEHGLAGAHRRVFGVIAWALVLPAVLGNLLPGGLGLLLSGPGGALLYRLSDVLAGRWGSRAGEEDFRAFGGFAADAFRILDWVPARLTGLSFAIVGDFEDAVWCWRSQAAQWPDAQLGIVLASGAGALGVRLGEALPADGRAQHRPDLGVGDEADPAHMGAATGLVWRALVLWLLVIALMTVASWV